MQTEAVFVVFSGGRLLALGPLEEVLPRLKARWDRGVARLDLTFDVGTGQQVDFDLRGSLAEVLARAAPSVTRGPGRPKLGVVGREVTLFPRHWEWLEQQPTGASGALRRLVEQASKAHPGAEQARRARAALSHILSSVAGDRPGFEEATRALFAGDVPAFEQQARRWPQGVRGFALEQLRAAAAAERQGAEPTAVVRELYRRVWSQGDLGAIEALVAPRYVVHADPGDAWEGQTLDRRQYAERVSAWRRAHATLGLHVQEAIAQGDRVAVRWTAEAAPSAPARGRRAAAARARVTGHTFFELVEGRVAGHWQLVTELGAAVGA